MREHCVVKITTVCCANAILIGLIFLEKKKSQLCLCLVRRVKKFSIASVLRNDLQPLQLENKTLFHPLFIINNSYAYWQTRQL